MSSLISSMTACLVEVHFRKALKQLTSSHCSLRLKRFEGFFSSSNSRKCKKTYNNASTLGSERKRSNRIRRVGDGRDRAAVQQGERERGRMVEVELVQWSQASSPSDLTM